MRLSHQPQAWMPCPRLYSVEQPPDAQRIGCDANRIEKLTESGVLGDAPWGLPVYRGQRILATSGSCEGSSVDSQGTASFGRRNVAYRLSPQHRTLFTVPLSDRTVMEMLNMMLGALAMVPVGWAVAAYAVGR
jgi:hypothetical protein